MIEINRIIEMELPLMYLSFALWNLGLLILFIKILSLIISKSKDKRLLIILSVIFVMLVSSIGLFGVAVLNVVTKTQ